jgi:hypothetical protein
MMMRRMAIEHDYKIWVYIQVYKCYCHVTVVGNSIKRGMWYVSDQQSQSVNDMHSTASI